LTISGSNALKIERIQTIVTCPGRNFVTVKIVTDEGTCGVIGCGTFVSRLLSAGAWRIELCG